MKGNAFVIYLKDRARSIAYLKDNSSLFTWWMRACCILDGQDVITYVRDRASLLLFLRKMFCCFLEEQGFVAFLKDRVCYLLEGKVRMFTSRTGFVAYFKDCFVNFWLAKGKDVLVQYIGQEEEEKRRKQKRFCLKLEAALFYFSHIIALVFFFLCFTAALFLS